ncbi:MAG: hypothetical protein IPK58_07885 [Acidobacteria bacterium]|nr:hypothetical protein [Acidobacteriota bacterium]
MFGTKAFTIAGLLLLLCGTLSVSATEKWLRIETENFGVIGDVSEIELQRVTSEFEALRRKLRELDPKREFRQPVPTTILAIHDLGSLRRFSEGDSFFVDGVMQKCIVFRFGDAAARRNAFRNFAMLLIDNEFGPDRMPAWLRVGVAEYFSSIRFVGDAADPSEIATDPIGSRRPIALETLFGTDHYSYNRQTRETATNFAARSASIVAHLLTSKIDYFPELIRTIEIGKPTLIALSDGYRMQRSDIERIVKPAPVPRFPPTKAPNAEGKTRTVGDLERRGLVAEILIGVGRWDSAASEVSVGENSSQILTIKGLIAERAGKYAAAIDSFEAAIAADPSDYRPNFVLALVLLNRESTEFGLSSGFTETTAVQVRNLLERTIELAPDFGDSYQLLAFLNSVRGEDLLETYNRMEDLLKIAPGNFWYRLRAAELQIGLRDFASARRTLLRLIRSAGTDRMRIYAENTLTRMTSLELQLASLKDKVERDVDGITDKPMSEEEIARRRERALNESLNLALRIPAPEETRILGSIERVECSPASVIVLVLSEGRTYKLRSAAIDGIFLTSYVDKLVNAEFGCGVPNRTAAAVVTFRPAAGATNSGELVSIEFVPSSFRFSTK